MRVCVIGHFAFGRIAADGQTIKTKILTDELVRQLGATEVKMIDTHGGIKSLLKAPFHMLSALKKSKNVVILPAHNGVRVYGRFLPFFKKFFKGRKIHYVVIGGWLSEFLKNKKGLSKALKKFDGIYVETNSMKKALEAQGFKNIFTMPNCKELTPISADELVYHTEPPYKLCTFSRVSKEKGIADAVEAVKSVNEKLGRTVYTLDIYGQVDAGQTEWFENLKKDFPEYVRYGGLVAFDKSVEVLKDYFALLFSTYYDGEGFAGTLIDSFAAGVPVIASDWKFNSEIVLDGYTGTIYEAKNTNQLIEKLLKIYQDPQVWLGYKSNCLTQVQSYIPEVALRELMFNLK